MKVVDAGSHSHRRAQRFGHGYRDPHLVVSHDKYGTRDIGGCYADLARAMGGWSERVERPDHIAGALARARKATETAQAALLEFITGQETRFSHRGALR